MSKQQGIGSNAIVFNSKDEILMLKRSSTDEAFPGGWEIPGGGVDYGETPQESLKREVMEECGLSVKILKLLAVHDFYLGEIQVFEITFLSKVTDDKYEVKLSSEHTDYKWISFKDTSSLKLNSYMSKVIDDARSSLNL
jgi:8-oxo-dGTP diphosphatase